MARSKRDPAVEYHRQLVREMYSNGNPIMRYLKGRGFRTFDIVQWQLGVVREAVIPEHVGYEGWISIPYRNGEGNTVGVRLRDPFAGKKGYRYHSPLMSPQIFGIMYCGKVYENLVITEGEFDCITVHKIGMKAVAVPGSATWKPEWRWLFRHVRPVILAVDGDDGGVYFKTRVGNSLKDVGIPYVVAQMPPKEDVNSMYMKDRAKLKAILRGAA